MQRYLFLSFFMFQSIVLSFGQANYFEYLSTKDGLSDYSINSLYEDEYARMWIATRNGLNCYDGQRFRVWSIDQGLQDTYVRSVVGDHAQHLLIQTRAHTFLMDLSNESLTPISSNTVSAIAGNDRGLWVVIADTLYQVFTEPVMNLHPILSAPGITAIMPIDSLTIWVASKEGVRLFKNGHATSTFFSNIHHVGQFMVDSRHNLWVCTRGDGLYEISAQLQLSHYTSHSNNINSLTDNDVRCITEDFLGNYWIGLYGGLCHLNLQTGVIQRYEYDPQAEHALSTFSVWALATDRQGTIWIGTFFGGIDLINPQHSIFTYYGAYGKEGQHLSNPIVTSSCMDKQQNLWIGTNGGGINYLNLHDRTIEHIRIDKENPQCAIKSMWMDNQRDKLWIGTHRGGLKYLDIKTQKLTSYRLPEKNVRKLICKNDTLWILTQHNLYAIDLRTMHYHHPIPENIMPIVSGEFCDITYIRDQIWFAHTNHLYCYSTSDKQLLTYPFEANITTLCTNHRNQLLVGTDTRGVWIKRDHGFEEITDINKRLPSQYIMSIASQEEGYIVASNIGVSTFNESGQYYSSFTVANGFPLEMLVEHSVAIYGSLMLIGGINGLVLCPLHSATPNIEPSAIQVSNILIDDENPQLETSFPLVKTIQIKPSNHKISIQVTTSGIVTRRNSRLRYRLKDYDSNWIITDNNALISYTNLPHGKYLLEIECLGTSLRREILIHVQPHWYNSWWGWILYFILGATGLCIALFYFGQYVEKKTRKQMKSSYQQDLQRATAIVMNHLADDTFNVQQFAKEMFVSRTGLYTKIQEITGQTPNDFILSLRMREAATLLRTEHTMSIVDISVRVGFNSSSYFIKCFHKFYGKSPTSWRKDTKNASTTGDGRRGK